MEQQINFDGVLKEYVRCNFGCTISGIKISPEIKKLLEINSSKISLTKIIDKHMCDDSIKFAMRLNSSDAWFGLVIYRDGNWYDTCGFKVPPPTHIVDII